MAKKRRKVPVRESKELVKKFLKQFGVDEKELKKPLMEMVAHGMGETEMAVPQTVPDDSDKKSDIEDPEKLSRAKARMDAMRSTRGLGVSIVASVAKKISKQHPVGSSFKDKLKHALMVQRAIDGINLHDAVEDYCQSIGIERPSRLGIYEALVEKGLDPDSLG